MFTSLLTQTVSAPVWAFHFPLQAWLLWGGIAILAVGVISACLIASGDGGWPRPETYTRTSYGEAIALGALWALIAAVLVLMVSSISFITSRDLSLSSWLEDSYGTNAENHITDLEKGRTVRLEIGGHVRAVQLIADMNDPEVFRLYESTALVPLPAQRG